MAPIRAMYIWPDGSKPTRKLRSKTKIIYPEKPSALALSKASQLPGVDDDGEATLKTFPDWLFDGSSTNQAEGNASDCLLKPVCFVPDPIRGEGAFLVLCEVFNVDGTPHETNTRAKLREVLEAGAKDADSWFGFEQEYTFFQGARPLGFPEASRFPAAQGPYYCGVGSDEVYGREVVEAHLEAMLAAGIAVTGTNAEVMPGQWEFQIGGPDRGPLVASDHVWLARWLLYRIGEFHGVSASLDAKPVPGDWNGAGMHTNFSTSKMRAPEGLKEIKATCEKFRGRVNDHLSVYGHNYQARLTGDHETCRYDEFRFGISDRTASIRIPAHVAKAECGYMEDRRPNGNADPYEVSAVMLKTTCDLWA